MFCSFRPPVFLQQFFFSECLIRPKLESMVEIRPSLNPQVKGIFLTRVTGQIFLPSKKQSFTKSTLM